MNPRIEVLEHIPIKLNANLIKKRFASNHFQEGL